jgi:putative endonuclease
MPSESFTYVYLLSGISDASRHYIGCTRDIKARLKSHNSGANPHTAKYRPWQIEVCIAFRDVAQMKKRVSLFRQNLIQFCFPFVLREDFKTEHLVFHFQAEFGPVAGFGLPGA